MENNITTKEEPHLEHPEPFALRQTLANKPAHWRRSKKLRERVTAEFYAKQGTYKGD